jgi:DNA-binding transcriptional LysR family regulator
MAMFVRVVDCGSFAAAAEASGVSATMVAKQVGAIEQRLGARLLHRTTRRQHLTEVGRLYYERCKSVLAEMALAEASAIELQSKPRGRLRLAAPVSFGAESLVPAIAEYMARYPEVTIELTLENHTPDLFGDGYELAIHIGPVEAAGIVARQLRPYRRILAAAPAYLDRRGRPTSPEELSAHSCLGLSYWRHRDRWRLTGPNGAITDVPVSSRFAANYGGALRAAALCGVGIVLQPELVLATDLAAGRLEPVLPDWSYELTPTYLIYAQDRRPTAMLRSAVEFLIARFGQELRD